MAPPSPFKNDPPTQPHRWAEMEKKSDPMPHCYTPGLLWALAQKNLVPQLPIDDPMAAWRLMVFLCFLLLIQRIKEKNKSNPLASGINWSVGVSNPLCILYNLSIIYWTKLLKNQTYEKRLSFNQKPWCFSIFFQSPKTWFFRIFNNGLKGSQRHSPSQGGKWRPLISTTHFCHEAWATWFFVVGRDVKGFTKKQNKKTPMKCTVILDVSCCVKIFCWQLIFSHVWRVSRLKLQSMSCLSFCIQDTGLVASKSVT